ncbi:MAG: ABC transporter transmembrane domain-containing protein, partial [Candidatus Dojkabacteria bacterium]
MNYELSNEESKQPNVKASSALRALYQYIKGSQLKILLAFLFLIIVSLTSIASPFIIGDVTNKYIPVGDKDNLFKSLILLAAVYIAGSIFSYFQVRVMGQVGQTILFRIRNAVFQKLQSLPLQFFNQNKSGDLISRINNDTDKMNQAFSETLLRFSGDILVIIGIAIVREIGPVITALIFAGKIASSIGAELGSMKVTEQIDAMEVSGTNPFKYLVVTRVMA